MAPVGKPVTLFLQTFGQQDTHPASAVTKIMIECLLTIFGLALVAPFLHWALRSTTHWFLGAIVAGITTWLALQLPAVASGATLHAAFAWVPALGVNFSLMADGLGLLMALIICGIGTLIVIYAGGYLADHPLLGRFYAYILLFMGSMLGVVLADNIIVLFIFWELTSISSYLLIGFDHERAAARAAALKALLVTSLGGLALLAGLLLMGTAAGSYELNEILTRGDVVRSHTLYVPILILILLGAATKSAQFPFHFWLPAAMEAPSPVSAYLHSATMVKAGVFLLARLTPALGGTPAWQGSLVAIGAITMLVGAILSLSSDGLKRILAYSTVSVLGTLTMLIGIGTLTAIQAAVLYLMAHALYKGALFLLAGSVSHATHLYDADDLGGLARRMPLTAVAGFLAALSMMGIPPLLGFIGKESLYEATMTAASEIGKAGTDHYSTGWTRPIMSLTPLAVAAHMLLFVVVVRVGVRPFLGRSRPSAHPPQEVSPSLWLGPLVPAVVGIIGGLLAGNVGSLIVAPAVMAVRGEPHEAAPLALWHGLTPELALSALTLFGGLILFAARRRLVQAAASLSRLADWGPDAGYDRALATLNLAAKTQTRVLQNGYLRWYLLTVLSVTVLLVGYPLIEHMELPEIKNLSDIWHFELMLAAMTLISAYAAVRATTRLGAVAALGAVGYSVALIYVYYGAPDLAMTQFLIETLMVILFVLVFYHLPPFSIFSGRAARLRDTLLALAFGAMMTMLILTTRANQSQPRISEYFVEHSLTEAHGRNIVNVILVDFRAIDTLGEITVLAVAAVGVFALLKLRRSAKKEEMR